MIQIMDVVTRIWRNPSPEEDTELRGMFSDPYPLVSHADEYPAVPRAEDSRSPLFVAAQWASHDIPCEKMPDLAADLLEQGWDTPSLRRLAGEMQVHSSADIAELVSKTFQELGVSLSLPEQICRLITSRQIAREVIAGLRDPWRAAGSLGGMWSWDPDTEELQTIDSILDEVDWERNYRRSTEDLSKALLDAFARLAVVAIPGDESDTAQATPKSES